jgi:microcin C transport system substrate-binding protein
VDQLNDAACKLQRIIHDEAIFVPGYTVDFVRIGAWRWVKWPDCKETRFSPPVVYDPQEVFVFWVDDAVKEETQRARRSGKSFPEVIRSIEDYRVRAPESQAPPDEQNLGNP